jgi:hypothetical protein
MKAFEKFCSLGFAAMGVVCFAGVCLGAWWHCATGLICVIMAAAMYPWDGENQ